MLSISRNVSIPEDEIDIHGVRAAGPGGQHANKAETAVHLRFDIAASSLPDFYKKRLLALNDSRISKDGVVVIKAREHRSRDLNEERARERLRELIRSVAVPRRVRRPTRPSPRAKARRVDEKKQKGRIKSLRKAPGGE